ncbi:inositol monophosphatase family protein [Haloferacaceae archaeon DSL9]
MSDTTDRAAVATAAAEAGAELAAESFRTGIDVETKDDKTDVVTAADRAAQRRVIEVIRESYPDDAIVGEEEDALKSVPADGAAWVIDPIDGTNNYVRDIRVWGTSVAAVVDGEPVAATNAFPALGDTYTAAADGAYRNETPIAVSDAEDPQVCTVTPTIWWGFDRRDEFAAAARAIVERFGDLRRFGCAQAVLSMVAEGSLDGALTNVEVNPWDSIAGVHLVRQAGGTVTDLHGEPWTRDSIGLVASNGAIHGDVLAAAREIDDLPN